MTNDSKTTDPRTELARLLGIHFPQSAAGDDYLWSMADVIMGRGFRKPRVITTAEELDTLPDEAVVSSDFGVIHQKTVEFDTDRVTWVCPGDTDEHTAGKITLPATVLYEPEAEAAR